MKKAIVSLSLAALAALFAFEARAELENRWFFSFGFNSSRPHFKGELGELDWSATWGMNPRLGYFFTDYLALEVSYQHFERFKAAEEGFADLGSIVWPYRQQTTVCGQNITLGAKGYLHLDRYIGLYGLLGFGLLRAEFDHLTTIAGQRDIASSNEADFGGRAGAGMSIYLYRSLRLEAEYSYNWGAGRVRDLRYSAASLQALILF